MEHRAITAPLQYSAFVSYNHRDRKIATRLQRRIEAYRLPRRIACETGNTRLKPVFRDRDELTAAPDLTEAVRVALRQSEYLIVVGTPNSARSEWVGREIDYFRSVHGDAAILTALYDGTTETAFHTALLKKGRGKRAHPLAADFRRKGDGRLALLKLIAVLAHVRLDELVQRDAQRRLRTLAACAAALLIGVIGIAALSIAMLRARATADAERARGTDAVEYQLTKMRGKLQGAGRLDLLGDLNRGVARFYVGRDPNSLTLQEQLNRAKLLQGIAKDDLLLEKIAAARKAATDASTITRGLAKAYPGNRNVLAADGKSEFYLGDSDRQGGAPASAQAHFQRYALLTQRLVAMDPANLDWRLEHADARSNLGTLLVSQGEALRARPLFEVAQADYLAVAAKRRGDIDLRNAIADGEAWLASCAMVARDYDGAFRHRSAQLAMLDALIRETPGEDVPHRSDRVGALIGLGSLALRRGETKLAAHHFDEAGAAAAELIKAGQGDEPLRRKARLARLLEVQAWLAMPVKQRPALAVISRAVGDCDADWRDASNQPLAMFCSVEAARVALAADDRIVANRRIAEVRAHKEVLVELSRGWNLDLGHELSAIDAQLRRISD